ncbi:hypothetical protein RCC89_11535 [Cytophagaceae bacterium ABcell3]|nr:hypothetical protein RCC89_11535 [Cytophagaceae bacterium ABcell3]
MKVLEKKDIKVGLLKKCVDMQTQVVKNAKKAMDEAQESANEAQHATEEMTDSFRETMQNTRDMFAKRYFQAQNELDVLKRIPVNETDKVETGAVIHTNQHNYYVSISLGAVDVDGTKYFAISSQSPIYKVMEGKKKGDEFTFRNQKIKITEVF